MDQKINIKTSILPKAIYSFNEISIKISVNIFHRNKANNRKFV